ncbi:hypothetical protein GCM10027578_23310 [Spirosoma luteolum]
MRPKPSSGPFTIISVDDDPSVHSFLLFAQQKVFPQAQVHAFQTTHQLTEHMLSGSRPKSHLLLLDLHLPTRTDGLRLLKQFRNDPRLRLVPIVVLSASDENADVEAVYDLGGSAFMQKPQTIDEWVHMVSVLKAYWYDTVTLLNK